MTEIQRLQGLITLMSDMEKRLDQRLDGMHEVLSKLEQRIEALEIKIDEELAPKLHAVHRLANVHEAIEIPETCDFVDSIDKRLTVLEQREGQADGR